ncbi:MAG: PorG [Deltaproteobacteria bacterium]|nr:PorG [Deltaproteobacteria bacterium]
MELSKPEKTGNPKERYEVVLAGTGGQGLIVSAMLLAEGAIREGKNAVQTQSYGIAARGGLSIAELIIDTEEIIFQQVQKPDVILALTENATERFAVFAERGALIFFDTTCLTDREGTNFWGFPFTKLASGLGRPGAANLIALGAMVARTGLIRMDSLIPVVSETFPKAAVANIEALRLGENLVASRHREDLGS